VTFRCLGEGDTDINLDSVGLVGTGYWVIPCIVQHGHVTGVQADLTVSDISWSPAPPDSLSEGDRVLFTVAIKNLGTGNANRFTVAYYIDGFKMQAFEEPLP